MKEMKPSLINLLKSIRDRIQFLRKEKGFDSALEFGNVANVNENRNETYLRDFRLSTLLKMLNVLDVKIEELVTVEMIAKYKADTEAEDEEREKRGE